MDYQAYLKNTSKYVEPTIKVETKVEPKQIDWEQRRYEIAKDVLANHTIHGAFKNDAIEFAVNVADMLIGKLKKTSK